MSGTYQRGTAINLVQDFWTVDPITQIATPANPTTVTFTILAPDNTEVSYVFGVDGNVTIPAVGKFVCALSPQLPPGTYRYRCDGTGAVEASSENSFDVIESGVLTPVDPGVPITGPCSSWVNGDDVAACGTNLVTATEHWRLDDVAYQASSLLYALSGRQFPGVCTRTVRPCQAGCSHFGSFGFGTGSWWWGAIGGWWGGGIGVGPYWVNDDGYTCGCGSTSSVRLSGYPVREILQVLIDGVTLPEFDPLTGARNWRLDYRTDLIRMWNPGGQNPVPQWWPNCQQLSLDDDQPGTFSVKYQWGADVPISGRMAAAQLARELWLACNGQQCKLPTKVTKVVRTGITMERIVPIAQMLRSGSTGIQLVDSFMAEFNPNAMRRRSLVWSPDDQQYAREVGQ